MLKLIYIFVLFATRFDVFLGFSRVLLDLFKFHQEIVLAIFPCPNIGISNMFLLPPIKVVDKLFGYDLFKFLSSHKTLVNDPV